MGLETLIDEKQDRIATLTRKRPERGNALGMRRTEEWLVRGDSMTGVEAAEEAEDA